MFLIFWNQIIGRLPALHDLNPVDYGIRENLTERVIKVQIRDLVYLGVLIFGKWNELPEEKVNRANSNRGHRIKRS